MALNRSRSAVTGPSSPTPAPDPWVVAHLPRSCSAPDSSTGAEPLRVDAVSRFGVADRMRRDRRERPDAVAGSGDDSAPRKTAPCRPAACPEWARLICGSAISHPPTAACQAPGRAGPARRHAPIGASGAAPAPRRRAPRRRTSPYMPRDQGRQIGSHPTYIPRPAASGRFRWHLAAWAGTNQGRQSVPELVFYLVAGDGFEPSKAKPTVLQGAHPCPSECPLTCGYSIPRRVNTAFCPCGVRSFGVCLVSATRFWIMSHDVQLSPATSNAPIVTLPSLAPARMSLKHRPATAVVPAQSADGPVLARRQEQTTSGRRAAAPARQARPRY